MDLIADLNLSNVIISKETIEWSGTLIPNETLLLTDIKSFSKSDVKEIDGMLLDRPYKHWYYKTNKYLTGFGSCLDLDIGFQLFSIP